MIRTPEIRGSVRPRPVRVQRGHHLRGAGPRQLRPRGGVLQLLKTYKHYSHNVKVEPREPPSLELYPAAVQTVTLGESAVFQVTNHSPAPGHVTSC